MVTRSIRGTLLLTGVVLALFAALATRARAVSVTITGPTETVFDWSTQRCDDNEIPDGPAFAFRDSLGRVQVIMPDDPNRRLIGPDFDHLVNDCTPVFASTLDPNPAHYNFHQFLNGTYTDNGRDIYALLHNEWHGTEVPGACPAQKKCGVGAVTFAVSHNNGDSYTEAPAPDNFVATVPPRATIDDPRIGLFQATAPVKLGNYFYSIALVGAAGDQNSGACMMRARDVTDPTTWRGWDGTGFGVRFRNPYYENVRPGIVNTCEPTDFENIMSMSRSITFDTVLNKFVLTGTAVKFDPASSQNIYGFYFSTSGDLVHWSQRQLLLQIPSTTTHQCGGPDAGSYPALIDQDATDPNFRITDDTVDLYYTVSHYNAACQQTLDRDLVRVPVQFSP